jgi:hypothetical protein
MPTAPRRQALRRTSKVTRIPRVPLHHTHRNRPMAQQALRILRLRPKQICSIPTVARIPAGSTSDTAARIFLAHISPPHLPTFSMGVVCPVDLALIIIASQVVLCPQVFLVTRRMKVWRLQSNFFLAHSDPLVHLGQFQSLFPQMRLLFL